MKNLLFFVAIILSMSSLSAQDIKVGGQLSGLSSILERSGSSLQDKVSFGVGVHGQIYLTERWSVIGKLGYQSKVFNYIEVPVMAQWHFGRNAKWYLQLGPYVGYALNPSSNYKNLDYGVAYGLGYEFELNNDAYLYIETAPTFGIANISNSTTRKVRSISSQFSVGYRYSLDW